MSKVIILMLVTSASFAAPPEYYPYTAPKQSNRDMQRRTEYYKNKRVLEQIQRQQRQNKKDIEKLERERRWNEEGW